MFTRIPGNLLRFPGMLKKILGNVQEDSGEMFQKIPENVQRDSGKCLRRSRGMLQKIPGNAE